mgnify:CR=1 FL=1
MTCLTTLKLLGDYWTLRLLDALRDQTLRYCQLQRAVDNLNPVTLTNRLKRLEEAGLVERHDDTTDKTAVIYQLTERGRQALPVIDALDQFAAAGPKG